MLKRCKVRCNGYAYSNAQPSTLTTSGKGALSPWTASTARTNTISSTGWAAPRASNTWRVCLPPQDPSSPDACTGHPQHKEQPIVPHFVHLVSHVPDDSGTFFTGCRESMLVSQYKNVLLTEKLLVLQMHWRVCGLPKTPSPPHPKHGIILPSHSNNEYR